MSHMVLRHRKAAIVLAVAAFAIVLVVAVRYNAIVADIAAAVPLSRETRKTIEMFLDAGMGAAAIITLLGGGGLIAFIVRQAFNSGGKKLILAA